MSKFNSVDPDEKDEEQEPLGHNDPIPPPNDED